MSQLLFSKKWQHLSEKNIGSAFRLYNVLGVTCKMSIQDWFSEFREIWSLVMRLMSPFVHRKEKINFDCFQNVLKAPQCTHSSSVCGAKFPYENYGILFAHFTMSNLFV
jgi:hypothetical protein